ncbi:MAG: HK97-gp10 family putative phage morphogenesis protein [Bacillota bacterium]
MKLRIQVRGAKEIQQALNMLPREVAGEHLREVALTGAEVIRAEAEQNALQHKRTGTLAGDIHKEAAQETLGTRVVVHIGPGRKGWYGRLVELGHAVVRGRKKAQKRQVGYAPPHPWLQPAFDEKKAEARKVMEHEFVRRMKRAWRV